MTLDMGPYVNPTDNSSVAPQAPNPSKSTP